MTATIVIKIERGDPLTDTELRVAHDAYRVAAAALLPLGPTFALAFREANRIANELDGYIRHRALK